MKNILVKDVAFTDGGTLTIAEDSANLFDAYVLQNTSPVTITSGFTVAHAGTPSQDVSVRFIFKSTNITYSAGNYSFFGTNLDTSLLVTGTDFIVDATYNATGGGNGWTIHPMSFGTIQDDSVITASILNENVTLAKIEDLARGSIITGQTASNRPTALDAKTSGQILVGDGIDIASVAVSGDVTMSSAGAVTIANNAVETAMINSSAVTTAKINGDAITEAEIADDAVQIEHFSSTGQSHNDTSSAATGANTTETDLIDFTVAANELGANGEAIDFEFWGTTGATATVKTLKVYLGANVIAQNTTTTSPNGLNWVIKGTIIRDGSMSQTGKVEIIFDNVATEIDLVSESEDDTAVMTLKLTGTNGTANANDIVANGGFAKLNK
jgi:hypothetical protein